MDNNKIALNLRKAYQKGILTNQQYKTLKGQCLSGSERAAAKGFITLLKQKDKTLPA